MQTQSTVSAPRISTGENTGSTKKTNPDRFSGKAFHAVRRYSKTRGMHRLFMATVSGTWASDQGLAWPAHSTIAESMNCSVRLVGQLQRELIDMGELEITGTSKHGTNILRLVCVVELDNFRPKKVSQKAEPKPRRKKTCTPPVQDRQPADAKSADKEPENFPSPNTIPLPSVSEEPDLKPGRRTNTSNRVEAPPPKVPATSPPVLETALQTGTRDTRTPLTPEERALAEKWFFMAVPRDHWRLKLPFTKDHVFRLRTAMECKLIPWPASGSQLAVMMQRGGR